MRKLSIWKKSIGKREANRRLVCHKNKILPRKHGDNVRRCIQLVDNQHAIAPLKHAYWALNSMLLTKKEVENSHKTAWEKCNILFISRIQKNQMQGVFATRCIVVRKYASYEEIRCQENSSSLTVVSCSSPTTFHDDEFYVRRVFLGRLWWKFTYIRDGIPWWYGLCQVNQGLGNGKKDLIYLSFPLLYIIFA